MNWISVEERLPDRGVDVLIYQKYCEVPCVAFLPMEGIKSWCANTDFYYADGVIESNISHEDVTHWMPLPSSPIDFKNGNE